MNSGGKEHYIAQGHINEKEKDNEPKICVKADGLDLMYYCNTPNVQKMFIVNIQLL